MHVLGKQSKFYLTVKLVTQDGEIFMDATVGPSAVVKTALGVQIVAFAANQITKTSTGKYEFAWSPTQTGNLTVTWSYTAVQASTAIDAFVVFDVASSTATTELAIKDWVKRSLGHPVVKVELSDDQLEDALDEAKRWYCSHLGGGRVRVRMAAVAGKSEYLMPTLCREVYDVVYEDSSAVDLDGDGWLGQESYSGGAGRGSVSQLMQFSQWAEGLARVSGSEQTWDYDQETNKLVLSPTPSAGYAVDVAYMTFDVDCSKLVAHELEILRRYTFAQAMYTLAWIRTKYSSLPSASGEISLNGDTLMAEATSIKSELEDKIKRLRTRGVDRMIVG